MGVALLRRGGRFLLGAVALAAAGCGLGKDARDPHRDVACVGCHRGREADSGRAEITTASCDRRGCHPDAGPDSARLLMVTFRHRAHGTAAGGVAVACATCHTHRPDSAAMVTDTTACALCHYGDIASPRQPNCSSCHPSPRHTRRTSQGVPIAHAQLDDAGIPCTRCHYQLVDGTLEPASRRCAECHRDTTLTRPLLAVLDSLRPRRLVAARDTATARATADAARRTATADSLHARHPGYGCLACHAPVRHRIIAMSTSVDLNCGDCHASRHRKPIPEDTIPTARCADCHETVHAEEQRLILGLLPDEPIRPSPMFMGGVTCRSCHVVPGQPGVRPGQSLTASDAACTGCHGNQWGGYLARWRRGYQRRDQWVSLYVGAALRASGDSVRHPGARAKARRARTLLAFLREAGPLHNLPASDRIMRDALRMAVQAYAAAGMAAPAAPELGPPVQAGTCISCHYGIEEAAAERDTVTGRRFTHGDHLFRAYLPCDACHAVGAPPPGIPDTLWIDTARGREQGRGPRRN